MNLAGAIVLFQKQRIDHQLMLIEANFVHRLDAPARVLKVLQRHAQAASLLEGGQESKPAKALPANSCASAKAP